MTLGEGNVKVGHQSMNVVIPGRCDPKRYLHKPKSSRRAQNASESYAASGRQLSGMAVLRLLACIQCNVILYHIVTLDIVVLLHEACMYAAYCNCMVSQLLVAACAGQDTAATMPFIRLSDMHVVVTKGRPFAVD